MQIIQTNAFRKVVKKLHPNQKRDLDDAVKAIANNPKLGTKKIGDLADVLVYKFNMARQITLLAYTYSDQTMILTLLSLGAHEKFYRDLKIQSDMAH